MNRKLLLALFLLITAPSFGQTWNEITEALPPPFNQTLPNQFFGYSIAVDGDYAVVGTYGYEDTRGAAYVLYHDGTNWTNVARLRHLSRDSDDRFGWSVDISGDNIVVGAYRESDPFANSGFAYVFTKPASGWTDMTQTARLEASDPAASDFFGISVAISGDNIVVGAHFDDDDGSASGSAYVFTKPGSGWTDMSETGKLTASDGAFSDKFGSSVGISGDIIVVGAPEDDDNGSNSGSVYLFQKPVSGWTNMNETAKLKPSDGVIGDHFGNSIDMSGDQIAVGAYFAASGGSAYLFEKPGTGWVNMGHTAKLTPSDGVSGDLFGRSVSVSGDNVVVGSYQDDDNGVNSGSAYVFTEPGSGWANMTQTAKLTASDGVSGDALGIGVGISGDKIICGASSADLGGTNVGSVYLYEEPMSGWINGTQDQKILPPSYIACPGCLYGTSVSIDGNYAVVGAPQYQNNGSAFVLNFDGSIWNTVAELTASDGVTGDNFGVSVSISADNVVVGADRDDDKGSSSGSAYVFTKPVSGWSNMTETAKLAVSDGTANDMLGYSVSIDGDNIVVGAYNAGVTSNEPGAVYVYTKPGATWTTMNQTGKLTASDGSHDDFFGYSVSISGDNAVVGSYSDDDLGSGSGSAYVFTKPGAGWANMTQTAKLNASDGSSTDYFGYSVSISGDNVVVGAYNDDDNQFNSGSAYVFTKPGATWANMTQTAKLNPTDGTASSFDFFGYSVSISGDKIAIGAYSDGDNYDERWSGSAYVFDKPSVGWQDTTHSTRIRAAAPRAVQDNFGRAIGISGDQIIVGTSRTDFYGDGSGSAYLFKEGCNTSSSQIVEACNSYTSPSGKYTWTSSNIYLDTIPNSQNCDSIITIDLTINTPVSGTDTRTECDTFTWIDGITYTSDNNTATFNIVNGAANGCDSLVTLDLTIVNSTSGTDTRTECSPFTWIDGNVYTSNNNTATFNLVGGGANGCDSLVSLDLTVIFPSFGTDTRTECSPYTWIDGNTYTANNNTATFSIVGGAANGCDSIVTLDLTILNTPTGVDTVVACDSYIWLNGVTYTSSNNSATFTYSNGAANGCDSIVTLDLTILNSATSTDTRVECDTYTWIDGITYTSSNSTATFTYSGGASNGCDSIVSLDLTIFNSANGTDLQVQCDSFTWIDGITYTSSNNTATFNIVGGASNGCDSLVSLDLTILNSSTGTDTRVECDAYTWIDGNTYTSNNNTATFNVVGGAANGCDSLVTLDLTIINSTTGTDTRVECGSYTWIDGNTYTSNNNTATFNIVGGAANGCDSLVTLDLTIINVDVTTTVTGATITANASGASYRWLDCQNGFSPIPGETGQSFTPSTGGSYAVEITQNSCVDTSACVAISSLEPGDGGKVGISVFPNPTSGILNIELESPVNIQSLELIDVKGRLITTFQIDGLKTEFDISQLAEGVYFLRTDFGERPVLYKVVKQ